LLKINVNASELHGYGVFASDFIEEGEVIEYCPFITVEDDDVDDSAFLQDYLFGSPFTDDERVIAPLGYAMLYNHSDDPNAEWYADSDNNDLIAFVALRDIESGEEILHSYGEGYWSSREEEIDAA